MPRPPKKFVSTPFAYHEEIELRIDALTNLGAGVGRVEGWVVFVPFTLPGERVRARVFRNDKNCSHADLIEVLDASPERVVPRCPLFGECGGCQYQHLDYASQLAWKTRQGHPTPRERKRTGGGRGRTHASARTSDGKTHGYYPSCKSLRVSRHRAFAASLTLCGRPEASASHKSQQKKSHRCQTCESQVMICR